MANTIRIKRSTGTTAPESLANAELAYSEGGDALYIGVGTGGTGGSATTIRKIAANTLFANQTATHVYAAPNAAAGAPSFRALVQSDITDLVSDLAGKASLSGATFTGAVTFNSSVSLGSATATTQATSDNSTKVATTAFVKSLGYSTTTGTVTSVGLSLPNLFTVSGSPVTGSGTLTATLASQTQRYVFAAPTSGNGSPAFRALDIADVTSLQSSLDAKASLAGATFTGAVTFSDAVSLGSATATTQATSDNSTKVATTAFVKSLGYSTTTGTVTSVGLSLPSIFTVSNSPVTASGTLTAALASQEPNTVFAGGAFLAGAPTFRALVAADIPTLTAAKISDFDTQVRTSRLDQMAAPTSDVSLNSRKITSLADPTSAQDAATKGYVDALKTGLDFKDSVKVATTANISLTGGLPEIDGVIVNLGDRVLVKNQSNPAQNGIYTASMGAWPRAADFDSNAEVTSGAFVFVEQGNVNADSGWVLSTDGAITVGTTGLTFTQFSGAGQIVDGDALSKSGNTLNVKAGTGITVANDDVALTGRALALHTLTSSGLITQTGAGTYAGRSVTHSGSGISVSNGDGVSGNPTVSLSTALSTVGGLTPAADRLPYYTSGSAAALATFTAFGRSLIDDADAAAARTTLALGSAATASTGDFQPADAELSAIAALTSAADRLPYFTGSGTAALATFTAFGRSLVDDADNTAARTTLGLGSIATQNSNSVSITGGTISGITLDNVTIDGGTW